MAAPTTAIIIGAGPSGISLAYHLKKNLGVSDFVVFDQETGVGGTWHRNTYPGCGCDVPSHFYSFSFNLNPNWSCPLADQGEILEYLNATVDKFGLRNHFIQETKCTGAKWDEVTETWDVHLQNLNTGHKYIRTSRVFVSGTGFFSRPKPAGIQGEETFQGASWHTGYWNHDYDLSNKRIAVIGNGCSGCQLIPAIAPKAKQVTHYARSRQWLFPRPNTPYTPFDKFIFRWMPGAMRFTRFGIYWGSEEGYKEYINVPGSEKLRAQSEVEAREYMTRTTPEKYLDKIFPDYPVGCKRRVFDPGYLQSLHRDNVELETEKIDHIDDKGIILADGKREDFDLIVYATGYSTQNFLAPMEVYGQGGKSLNEHWQETGGCQAYHSTVVSGFPNMAILFGPNAAPAHNSSIFAIEVQVEYAIKAIFEPLLSGRASKVVVKRSAEDQDANEIQRGLKNSVWTSGCTNWTIDKNGRNTTSFPDYVRMFWWRLRTPKWQDYLLTGGQNNWRMRHTALKVQQNSGLLSCSLLSGIAGLLYLQSSSVPPQWLQSAFS